MGVMENTIEVTDADFEQLVIEGSKSRPVIVDLWAAWCGPCRTLGPILEKVAHERAGAFLLAKIDVDANPMIASALGAQSIPMVVAFRDGQAVTGFVGAYPEDDVNRFVDSVLPSEAELVTEEAQAEEAAGDTEGAEQRYRDALGADPANKEAAVGLGRLLADRGLGDEAVELVRPHLPDPDAERVMAIVTVDSWADLAGQDRVSEAKRKAAAGSWSPALDEMLAALPEDKDAVREAMVTVFAVIGDEDPLVATFRRKLTAALF